MVIREKYIDHEESMIKVKLSSSTNKRMMKGGHSQKNIDKLNEYGISYNIEKTYTNGVRVGNVPEHTKMNIHMKELE